MTNSKTLTMLLVGAVLGSGWACSSKDDNSGGKGGNGGSDSSSGGSGGKSSGGSGGSNKGGSGGSKSGGTGGTAMGGSGGTGMGATGGTGGTAMGGSGGTAMGGSGGTAMGGTGGTPMTAPGPVTGPGVLFSGADMNVTKLLATDAMAGYAYVTSAGTAGQVNVVAETDPALPMGTKFSWQIDSPTTSQSNVIFGFNFRQNKPDGKWNWYDATGYAGIQFWAKTSANAAVWNFTLVDATNLPSTSAVAADNVGTCPSAMREQCPGVKGKPTIVKNTWQQFKVAFTGLSSDSLVAGELDVKNLGRVDLILLAQNSAGIKLWVTGVKLLKQDELE